MVQQEFGTADAKRHAQPQRRARRYRCGAVPFLVGRPLIYGLDGAREIELVRGSPPHLKRLLANGELDAALVASSDLPCFGRRLVILPAGCVASSGPTLAARIFSQVRPEELRVLWADSGARSAVTLVQLLWATQFQRRISVIPFDPSRDSPPHDADAVLVIGDRVVAESPIGFDWQFDPAGMWYEMTGLPFVFAVWATLRPDDCGELYHLLLEARRTGERHLEQIAAECAPRYEWPVDLATRSLTSDLQFEFTDAHREGLEEFLEMGAECGLIEQTEPLHYYRP